MKFSRVLLFLTVVIIGVVQADCNDEAIKAEKRGEMQKVKKFLQKACDKQNAKGCYNLGLFFLQKHQEKEAKRYLQKAKKLFEKECEKNIYDGCKVLSLMYAYGIGVSQNYKKALKLAKKACDGKDGDGCSIYGTFYTQANDYSNQAYTIANRYYKKACDMRIGSGCYDLAYNYLQGRGTPKNDKIAQMLFKQACILGYDSACKKLKETADANH